MEDLALDMKNIVSINMIFIEPTINLFENALQEDVFLFFISPICEMALPIKNPADFTH